MMAGLLSLPRKAVRYLKTARDLRLIQSSGLFDQDWYLAHNADVAQAKADPLMHFLRSGGIEGRDPCADFSCARYLDAYQDVRSAGINPLVHYLRYGRQEGRTAWAENAESTESRHRCPVCQKQVDVFLPFPAFYTDNREKHGYPYTPDDSETMNTEGYGCPHCGATDRDRLYALYLAERISRYSTRDRVLLLDIAPSAALSHFIRMFSQLDYRTADLFMEGVDMVADVTHMPEIGSDTCDIIICSHVLEHVRDDRQALAELYRVLKPGGWAILMVPIILAAREIDEDPHVTDVAERWRRFGQFDHVRLYSKRGFISRVEGAGFALEQLGVGHFGRAVFQECGIASRSVLYVAEK